MSSRNEHTSLPHIFLILFTQDFILGHPLASKWKAQVYFYYLILGILEDVNVTTH